MTREQLERMMITSTSMVTIMDQPRPVTYYVLNGSLIPLPPAERDIDRMEREIRETQRRISEMVGMPK
jgi:hypothetical protein